MSKRHLSPVPFPPAKRTHNILSQAYTHTPLLTFDTALYDELILFIFAHLSWTDLCSIQAVNKYWARLASDDQLWKALYVSEYGRARLRGVRGHIGRNDGREVRPLPGRAKVEDGAVRDWKWMFRISSNWRTGRCAVEQLSECPERPRSSLTQGGHVFPEQTHILLAGNLTMTASSQSTLYPPIHLRSPSGTIHTLLCGSPTHKVPTQITALALDQSPPTQHTHTHNLQLASFLSTGEFTIFTINHTTPSSSTRKLTYVPTIRNTRTAPIIHAVFHQPLLITLSKAFHLSIYDLSGGSVVHCQTLTSFTSYPPSSLVLSTPSPTTYKLVLAYAIPVYPAHWSVGATELIISGPATNRDPSPSPSSTLLAYDSPLTVITTRTTRAIDVPQGWIDENKLRSMREQWGRKVERVADTQTDGKWVVIAPGGVPRRDVSSTPSSPAHSWSSSSTTSFSSPIHIGHTHSLNAASSLHSSTHLQLYRLHLPSPTSTLSTPPKLTFIRTLHGQTGCISALALADGRCVSLSANGSLWVWDLEAGTGAEVARPSGSVSWSGFHDEGQEEGREDTWDWNGNENEKGTVVFDERRIISAGVEGVQVRRFDV